MQVNKGSWIGFVAGGFCLGLVLLAVLSAAYGWGSVSHVFSQVCHQNPGRCYQWGGVPLPVCVRCLWVYCGLAFGHGVFLFWKPSRLTMTRALTGVIGLVALDVVLEFFGLYENWFWSRALTGFLFGFVVSYFTLPGLRELYFELNNPLTYVRSLIFPGKSR